MIKVQRPDGDRLHVGDNFSLFSKRFSAWLEAEVYGIDDENQSVQVAFVSPGIKMKRQWISIQSPLISLEHKRCDAASPIVW